MSLVQNFNSLFAPMDKKYCEVFFFYSMISFFILVIAIFHFLFLFTDVKRNKGLIFNSLITVSVVALNYIYNRLLYNMCK